MEPAVLDIKRQGDLGGAKIAMGIDENALAHIMSVLTDLYSDPTAAIIREYSTNAFDAHIEAGQTRPIEITTPTQMSPYFKIKDFGVGLSVDDINQIYSKYGASSKRETNDQVGMLGLGCKSALTFTQQFTLVSVKNGVKVTVSISRVEDGTGVMEIVDTRGTSEPNGVEVVIPVRENYQFNEKVRKFFRFWTPGTVLINGEAPERIKGTEVAPGILLINERQDYIVMGNVAYPVANLGLADRDYNSSFGVVAFVEIGDVNFVPSREALHYTEKTKATVARVKAAFAAGLIAAMEKDIASAPTHEDAIAKYLNWSNTLGQKLPGGVKYKGEVIPTVFSVGGYAYKYTPSQTRYNTNKVNQLSYREAKNCLIITDFNPIELTPAQRKKARIYMEENPAMQRSYVIFAEKDFIGQWMNNATVSWDTVKKSVSTKKRSSDNMPFRILGKNGYFVDVEELEEDADIIFFGPNESSFDAWGRVQALFPDHVILRIGANRHAKLQREFPGAVHYRKIVMEAVEKALAALTEDDKVNHSVDRWRRDSYARLDATKIDDPEVIKFLSSLKRGYTSPTLTKWEGLRNICQNMYISCKNPEAVGDPLLRYPLMDGNIESSKMDHIYTYMNAVYKMNKENDA